MWNWNESSQKHPWTSNKNKQLCGFDDTAALLAIIRLHITNSHFNFSSFIRERRTDNVKLTSVLIIKTNFWRKHGINIDICSSHFLKCMHFPSPQNLETWIHYLKALPENTASPRIVPFSRVFLEPPSVVYLKLTKISQGKDDNQIRKKWCAESYEIKERAWCWTQKLLQNDIFPKVGSGQSHKMAKIGFIISIWTKFIFNLWK